MGMSTADQFAKKKCVPCEGGVPVLTREQASEFLRDLKNWMLNADGKSISSEYRMKDFQAAVDFINCVAEVAEAEDHHPDIHLTGYRKLVIELSTHAIGGLSENDLILAAKIDQLPRELQAFKK